MRRAAMSLMAHHDRPPFLGRPSLTGHNGHGWTCRWFHPVAIDPKRSFGSPCVVTDVIPLMQHLEWS
jgi:hypothetical protein